MKINDMEIEINKNFYHKSKVEDDGITHTIDVTHKYSVYQVGMAKNYFNIEDESELLDSMIGDLKAVIEELEKLKEKKQQKQKEKE